MWLLAVLIVLWVVLTATWVVLCRRERQQGRTGQHPAHRPVSGPRLRSAMSVAEIQRRLAAEAARLPPPVRNITILPREAHPAPPPPVRPADTGPDTEPFGALDDGSAGAAGKGR